MTRSAGDGTATRAVVVGGVEIGTVVVTDGALAGTEVCDAASRARASREIDRPLAARGAGGDDRVGATAAASSVAGAATTATGSAGAGCGALRM